ncbi:putative membrane-associated protein [Pseudomonas coronafaciens pv. coronafaciens]|nr:putative membrane-associated protein [Pseudomonas coronafaciens pv. coronafaciens]
MGKREAMATVYVFEDKNRTFGAFWESDAGVPLMFLPHYSRVATEMSKLHWEAVGARHNSDLYDANFPELHNLAKWSFGANGIEVDLSSVSELITPMGCFNPRVWRGIPASPGFGGYEGVAPSPLIYSSRKQATVAATSLFSGLVELFRYVEPSSTNDQCFGHRARELLILACTEVESHWKGVLLQNMKNPPTPSFKPVTKDYIKLAPILRLKDWRVMLKDYFGYRLIAPFEHWDTAKPSQSLEWYSAYNAVKHDREGKFEQAQIQFVIEAMAAVHVMLAAQWGPEIHSNSFTGGFSPFQIISMPTYAANEQYVCPSAQDKIVLNQAIPFGI